MKKIRKIRKTAVLFGIVSAISISAFGWTNSESNLIRKAEAFAAGYETNQVFRGYNHLLCVSNGVLAAHVDEILKNTPPLNFVGPSTKDVFPKTHKAAIEDLGKEAPFLLSEGSLRLPSKIEDKMVYYLVSIDHFGHWSGSMHEKLSKLVLDAAGKNIRKHLRSQGKRIVSGPDGIDPCKAYIDDVISAINSPRYEGLSNSLSRCGIDIYVPRKYRAEWDDETLRIQTNSIFIGETPFTREKQIHARFALGLEEYNKFVERYNGGAD